MSTSKDAPAIGTAKKTEGKRRFQFHLITALAMMVVAGVFVGLNTVPHEIEPPPSDWRTELQRSSSMDVRKLIVAKQCGFPFAFLRTVSMRDDPLWWRVADWIHFAADFCILLLLLGFTWFVSEWIIHRRAKFRRMASGG
jgi:hypothetical protein